MHEPSKFHKRIHLVINNNRERRETKKQDTFNTAYL